MSNNLHDKINLNHLCMFQKIAQCNSLTDAAKLLRIDKGRLSRILKELEQSLGITLIHRTTREFRVTPKALDFLAISEHAFQLLNEAVLELKDNTSEPEGRISITAPHGVASAFLPEVVVNYSKAHPKVQIELNFSQNLINIDRDNVDLAIRMGNLPDSSIKVRKLGEYPFKFYATPQYLATHPKPNSIEELSPDEVIVLSQIQGKRMTFKKNGQQKIKKFNAHLSTNSPEIILDMTLQGKGIGLIPKFICGHHVSTGQLKVLFPEWSTAAVPMHLVSPSGSIQLPHVKHFADYLFNYIKSRP